jgi:23S rRNA (guanosine2251-2'-O)-methyltransferase
MASDDQQLEKINHDEGGGPEIIFGLRPVAEAIRSGKTIDRVLMRNGLVGEGLREMMTMIRRHRIPVLQVPEVKLNQLTRGNHQGIVALVSSIAYIRLEELLDKMLRVERDPFLVITDRVTDVRNFGAIARTAECAGADAIIIPDKGSARINAESVKASAGALMRLPVVRVPNLFKSAVTMLEKGITLIAATEKGDTPYFEADLTGPVCLILGSEEDGISAPLLKMSEKKVTIPQYGTIGSLNVSVAAGIVLFEAARQRKTSDHETGG